MIKNLHPIAYEPIWKPERFSEEKGDRELFERAFSFVKQRVDEGMATFYDPMDFPPPCSENNFYRPQNHFEWTASFWTGLVWLCYEMTRQEKYKVFAMREAETYFADRLENHKNTDTHDLGFLYILSSKPGYLYDGDGFCREMTLDAARLLRERFLPQEQIIQAIGKPGEPKERGIYIADCAMNVALLYWAAKETGDKFYAEAADAHMAQVARKSIKEDASCYHKVRLGKNGQVRELYAGQGYSLDGCWSRGISWLQYGYALSYGYTGEADYLEISKKVTNYHLNRLPEDLISCWDLYWTDGSENRDSSAAAITASGLVELSRYTNGDEGRLYYQAACAILRSLCRNYLADTLPESNGILLHGEYAHYDNIGVDECCIWGDYFFAEALLKVLKPEWKGYW